MARGRSAFTLIELLVCIGIAIVLAMILAPVFMSHGGCGNLCEDKLRKLGTAVAMYMQDYDETYPAGRAAGDQRRSGLWTQQSQPVPYGRRIAPWVIQLLPYVYSPWVFACRQDVCPERNQTALLEPGSETPMRVSYGLNRWFTHPLECGWKKPSLSKADVERPGEKYLLADCATAYGFDVETIAYLRYPNYDPSEPQNDWTPAQFVAAGRVAWPDKVAEPLTRHRLSNNIMFADGHVKWLRHDQIPSNDGPGGKGYRALVRAMVPWRAAEAAGDALSQ